MRQFDTMKTLEELKSEIKRQIPRKSEITSLGGGLVVLYGPAVLPIIDHLEQANKILREALSELVEILGDPEARKEVDSFTAQPARTTLAAVDALVGER